MARTQASGEPILIGAAPVAMFSSPVAMFSLTQQPSLGGASGTFMPRVSSGPNPTLGRQRLASGATPLLVHRRYA